MYLIYKSHFHHAAIGGFVLHFTVLMDMACCELPNLWIQSRKDMKRFLSFNHLACRCVGSLGTRVQSTGLNVSHTAEAHRSFEHHWLLVI